MPIEHFSIELIVAPIKLHMSREQMLRVRLSEEEYERLKEYALSTDRQISEVIRDYIKRLPKTKTDGGFIRPSRRSSTI